jgi:hypothetical protein
MSRRGMDWRRARLAGRPTLDHRFENDVPDRAERWLFGCFRRQRAAAKQRGVPFHFTFEEWSRTWKDSGRLHQRGTASGNYVMGRRGDVGGYASSNVEIITVQENTRAAAQNRKLRQAALTAASTDWITASSTGVPW